MCTPFDAPRVHDFFDVLHAPCLCLMAPEALSLSQQPHVLARPQPHRLRAALFFAVSHKLRPSAAFQREALKAFHRTIAREVFSELELGIVLVPNITT